MIEMTGPVGPNVLDAAPQGLIGKPLDRVDGRAKVMGKARYAYEARAASPALYGFIVESTVGKGRIQALDTRAAERAPGVVLVLTHLNVPAQGSGNHREAAPQLTGDDIRFRGQPIAFVVAEQFEQARAAAKLVHVTYDEQPGRYELSPALASARLPKAEQNPPDSAVGTFEAAYAAAPVKLDLTYNTPVQSHAMMEPHATLAWWDGDKLTLQTSNQRLSQGKQAVARTLRIPPDDVRLISEYVGGGFGAKLWVGADAILAALAARAVKRPVKVALTRQQVFAVTTHRSDTVQRLRLGADNEGRLVAIGHDAWSANAPGEEAYETAAQQTRTLYAAPNRLTRHRLAALDLPTASAMRAPGEAVGMLALECALDELAFRLNLDPIELRIRNEATEDPEKHVPYSTRNLVPCLREGARRFGWDRRRARPGEVQDGRWLVGMGVAAATRQNPLQPSKCLVRLEADGTATVRMAMTDIGTGSYTVFTQIAGEMLGLPPERIRMELGDTAFPQACGSGGSFGAASAGSALFDGCTNLRAKLADAAGMDAATAVFIDGEIRGGGRSRRIADLAGADGMQADGELKPGTMTKQYSQQSYGAHFAEVGVDQDTGEIRLRRMLGVFTAGRILNEKTARSQAIGGMIFGVGAALTEEVWTDPRYGQFVNRDLAEYHVPVHADIAQLDAVFLPELDDKANPLKSKGVGELGICGAGAAVANAVFNASGVRIREYPLTLDKVLAALPQRT